MLKCCLHTFFYLITTNERYRKIKLTLAFNLYFLTKVLMIKAFFSYIIIIFIGRDIQFFIKITSCLDIGKKNLK